ncbi:MAG TPA: major capsid protein [Desulfosporosinus sp.]|nr:major capsid protein [Desulfosporosinus sp.]
MNEFIFNGQASGAVATRLLANDFNVHCLRPYIGQDGRTYITTNVGGKLRGVPTNNAIATLRKDDWKQLDLAIVKAAMPRLKAVADLRSMGLTYNVPNGMGKTILETERMSDVNDATISMDGLREGADDRPHFDLLTLPLPIIHKDFSFSARQIAASRSGGTPLDTSMAEASGRKVAEEAEKLLLGVSSSYSYGGGVIYGYTNFPSRITKTITSPVASGWTGQTLLTEILDMRALSVAKYHYGPWMMYTAPNWSQYLDTDFSTSKGSNTVRERIQKVDGITDIRTLDYLEDYDIVMVQMTTDIVREVIGMDITTLQWETNGGMLVHYKVMAILVPQLRADFNSNTGIVHGGV